MIKFLKGWLSIALMLLGVIGIVAMMGAWAHVLLRCLIYGWRCV